MASGDVDKGGFLLWQIGCGTDAMFALPAPQGKGMAVP